MGQARALKSPPMGTWSDPGSQDSPDLVLSRLMKTLHPLLHSGRDSLGIPVLPWLPHRAGLMEQVPLSSSSTLPGGQPSKGGGTLPITQGGVLSPYLSSGQTVGMKC